MALRFFVLVSLFLIGFSCKADIGETYDMLNKREQLIKENERLLNGRSIDSLSRTENSRYIENLHIINLIDEEIFKSQRETIDRLSSTSGNDQYVNKSIALLCFLFAVLLAVSLYSIFLLNKKLNRFTGEEISFSARLGELFSALLLNFQPAQTGKSVAVNRLIILAMVFMFISFLGYLFKTLGV